MEIFLNNKYNILQSPYRESSGVRVSTLLRTKVFLYLLQYFHISMETVMFSKISVELFHDEYHMQIHSLGEKCSFKSWIVRDLGQID